jgi:hypothetical protein
LVSVAFLVDFTRKYGRVGFFIYWMANWVTMSGLGFVMETLFLWLGILILIQEFSGQLIKQVHSSLSSSCSGSSSM